MSAFHGNFFVRSTDLLSLAAVPMDQSYAIEIQIEDPISAPFVVFQTAVLHTTAFGERRIRVITTALPTTSSISEVYGGVDTVALATLLADKAVERSMQSKLEDARDAIVNKLVDILGTYKATMTSTGSGPSPQLVVSDNMKFLPLLMLGLLKHVSCRPACPRRWRVQSANCITRLCHVGWIASKYDDTVRLARLRSSAVDDSAVANVIALFAPCVLFAAQHAQRCEWGPDCCESGCTANATLVALFSAALCQIMVSCCRHRCRCQLNVSSATACS